MFTILTTVWLTLDCGWLQDLSPSLSTGYIGIFWYNDKLLCKSANSIFLPLHQKKSLRHPLRQQQRAGEHNQRVLFNSVWMYCLYLFNWPKCLYSYVYNVWAQNSPFDLSLSLSGCHSQKSARQKLSLYINMYILISHNVYLRADSVFFNLKKRSL